MQQVDSFGAIVGSLGLADRRFSVLGRATSADVSLDPFPHIVLQEALPQDLYDELAASFPSEAVLGVDTAHNNKRWNHHAGAVASNQGIPLVWKKMIAYHSSKYFLEDIVSLFFDAIHQRYPRQFPTREYMDRMRVGTRGTESFNNADVLMEAMIAGNTPVQSANSVRTTHVDQGRKLFSGLFYMRRPGDDSVGGDLTISRFRPELKANGRRPRVFNRSYVDDQHVETVRTVTYARNTVVLFINTLESLHGVTVRKPTPHGRYFVNLVGEVDPRLYRVPKLIPGAGVYSKLLRPADAPRSLPIRVIERLLNL